MPYTVTITADEANLLTEAKIDGVEGGLFTFNPSDSLEIVEIASQHAAPGDPGRQRLSDRLAALYGTYQSALARKREDEQASADASVFDGPPNTAEDGEPIPVYTNENPVNVPNVLGVDVGLEEAPSPAPRKGRRRQ